MEGHGKYGESWKSMENIPLYTTYLCGIEAPASEDIQSLSWAFACVVCTRLLVFQYLDVWQAGSLNN